MSRCRLYLITPPALEPEKFAPELEAAIGAGDVASVQLRLKNVADDAVLRAGRILMPIVQRAGAAFIVNDRPDLAAALGADGVHVGQEDASYGDARALVGKDRIVGVTCHASRHFAIDAAEQGADYVAFGAMFPTSTKEAKTRCEIELIQWWAEMMVVPCVAIGGITVENCWPVIEAGADFLAVASGVWDFPQGPAAAVQAFNRLTAQS
ncbi:MAG TPA: thiamine phosphate synthase [Micropepsaceae bacterium]|nr:thiamine phosphate synthase [Micropepsaceae bacterium]